MYFQVTTPPDREPVSIDLAKTHLRVDSTEEDAYISQLIRTARQHVERITGYVCIHTEFTAYLGELSQSNRIFILKNPVTAVTEVAYESTKDSGFLIVNSSDWKFEKQHPPSVLVRNCIRLSGDADSIRVKFTAGHVGDANDPVPPELIQASLILVSHLYENRQEEITGTQINRLSKGFEYLCDSIRTLTP